jgi:hypothetical protein
VRLAPLLDRRDLRAERDRRILEHLGLPSEVPVPGPARAPPQGELDF